MVWDLVNRIGTSIKRITSDGVIIIGVSSGAVVLYVATKYGYPVIHEMENRLAEITGATMPHPHKALLALNASSGSYAASTNNLAASVALQSASLLPDIYEIVTTGDISDAVNRAFVKTVVFGSSYIVSYIFKHGGD